MLLSPNPEIYPCGLTRICCGKFYLWGRLKSWQANVIHKNFYNGRGSLKYLVHSTLDRNVLQIITSNSIKRIILILNTYQNRSKMFKNNVRKDRLIAYLTKKVFSKIHIPIIFFKNMWTLREWCKLETLSNTRWLVQRKQQYSINMCVSVITIFYTRPCAALP